MPELPDIEVYVDSLDKRVQGENLTAIRIANPFLLRSVSPPLSEANGRCVTTVSRLGKRIVFGLEGELYLVLHLMIAGRLKWSKPSTPIPGRSGLAAFDFTSGTLLLTEAGSKRRASLYLVSGRQGLAAHDPGGLEVLECTLAQFRTRLGTERHTLKRSLTDPHLFSGIGNAYSDEILHHAQLSPFKISTDLTEDECARLFEACREILVVWTERLRQEAGDGFPDKVTAFRKEMAVHGRFREPCPVCGAPVQRIVYAANEANYCAGCQTGGKILADRMLSRLLKDDWPRTLDELETIS
jgi:formamidopyrimidine-DNA glycosylase